jgi:hypothetical protein
MSHPVLSGVPGAGDDEDFASHGNPVVIEPMPPDDHRSADEIMAEWLMLYEHSEEIQRRLRLLARQLSEHITQVVQEQRSNAPQNPATDPLE